MEARLRLGAGGARRLFPPLGSKQIALQTTDFRLHLGKLAFLLAPLTALPAQLDACSGDGLHKLGIAQPRQDLGREPGVLGFEIAPLEVAVNTPGQLADLVLQGREVIAHLLELALGLALLRLGLLIGIEDLLVAEDLEHQIQEQLGGILAELVGLALLEGQDLGHGGGDPGIVEAALVIVEAQPLARGFERLDRDLAGRDQVLALPVAALLADAAGQRHHIVEDGEEGIPAVSIRRLSTTARSHENACPEWRA